MAIDAQRNPHAAAQNVRAAMHARGRFANLSILGNVRSIWVVDGAHETGSSRGQLSEKVSIGTAERRLEATWVVRNCGAQHGDLHVAYRSG